LLLAPKVYGVFRGVQASGGLKTQKSKAEALGEVEKILRKYSESTSSVVAEEVVHYASRSPSCKRRSEAEE
jgi:hypothetical protein